jgi:tRNA (uracil-5-)-methyltransferase
MKFNDLAQGTVTRFDDKGRGVFDVTLLNSAVRPMAVPFTVIGDLVEAKFIKRDKGGFIGALERVITPSPDRIPPPSPALDRFPGALWLHIKYDAQLRFKRDLINRALEEAKHEERVTEVVPSSVTSFYRNRMDYPVGWKGEIGFKEFGSWSRYREVSEDVLLSPNVPTILQRCREIISETGLKPWDNRDNKGDVRYVVIREGKNTKQRMIALIVKDLKAVTRDMRSTIIAKLDDLATSVLLGENPEITDLSYAKTIDILKGDETLEEVVNNTRYRTHLNSFFQTNSTMSATLQDIVADFISIPIPNPQSPIPVLDLYCGLGFFGINLATRNPSLRVSGFEIDAQAIELAKENAKTNNVADRCTFMSGPAEDLSWKDVDTDVVILDPPRSGLHPRVLDTLLAKKPKTIIYVSCNFRRLVAELTRLKTLYRIEAIKAVDMFPHTPHVEVLTKLVLI